MLCSRCKKRPAVVFVSTSKDMANTQGLCMSCAKEMGVKPISDLINRMGISEDELNAMQDRFSDMIADNREPNTADGEIFEEDIDEMGQGGATTFPFIKGIFADIPFVDKHYFNPQDSKRSERFGKDRRFKRQKRKYVDIYCTNLNAKAKSGALDRIIGREDEIARIVQILCRRTKNNPCLTGEPGVGKTAIAEGLAIRIVQGNVPSKIKNKEIYLLDLTALVAGTQFRGQFENRIKGLIEEVKRDGNIILFIDEVHNLVGTGDSEGSMSAANILKPALSRGEIQVIGATTFNEYRKHIEKDSALERRFQQVKILEPSVEKTIEVIKGIKSYYESYHRISVPDYLVSRMVTLSERYITDRFLPDKAIDLLDEACTCAELKNKDIEQYDIVNSQLETVRAEEDKLLSFDTENTDYKRLAEVRCEEARLEKQLDELHRKAFGKEVTEQDVSDVIELWTGIPSSKIQQNEFQKLANLDERLKEKIIGQDKAVDEVAAAIRRSRVRINPKKKPASFIFVGSTGVGKTELVKALAQELFDTPDALIKIDMSEYLEKHSVSKLIGSPPGYVGYDEAGQITEKVRQRPYSVLLFDEIEKGHPDVMNILLQILDEGRVTDSHGRTINFEHTIIVMTSNAGSERSGRAVGFSPSQNDLDKEKAMRSLSEFLRPEFLSRVDEVVVFNKLKVEDFEKIARLTLIEYSKTLSEHGIVFEYDEESIKRLAKQAIGGKSGARDLLKLVRKEVEDKISSQIIQNGGFKMEKIMLTGVPVLDIQVV